MHGHDAMWHLAIANASFKKFPFVAPTFAGEALYGYNYFLDLIIYLLSLVGIPSLFTYFKLLPIVWFILYTILLIRLAVKIKDSPLFVSLFLFFSYFAGSFSYLLTLYHYGTIGGSSTLLPQPTMHMMSNLPYAFSLLPFLALLIFIKAKKFTNMNAFVIGFCIFIIMGLKFYGGVISIFFIEIYLLYEYIIEKKFNKFIIRSLIIGLFILVGVFTFYNPGASLKTGFIFGFAPFALVHTITEETNQFYLRSLTDARYYIMAQKKIGPRLIGIETLNLVIFLFFYLGTRFFAFIYIGIQMARRKLSRFDAAIISTILFSILLTVLLVQKAEWWNSIQFFFYAIFLLTIYLTFLVYNLLKSKEKMVISLGIIFIVLSVVTSIDLVKLFLVVPGAAYLPVEEMKALQFLKKQPDGVVLTSLYNKELKSYNKPNPLYRYEDTAYVTAFSGKQVYFANILQLRLTGVPYLNRLERIKKHDCSILNEVDYIYEIRELKDEEKFLSCYKNNVKKIYDSGSIFIYRLIR